MHHFGADEVGWPSWMPPGFPTAQVDYSRLEGDWPHLLCHAYIKYEYNNCCFYFFNKNVLR